jgi:aerobic-type carbon monoxide dehydrogenase small subunit (CoxS/CutS family)
MASITFTVNGANRSVDTDPQRPLLDVLREDLDLTGTKYGCGEGSCRSCTVLVDGRPLASCQVPIAKVEGKSLITIEGLADGDALHPVQEAFVAEGAMQCGYCVPGMILTAVALLEDNPKPTREQIVEFMDGNLCRCCNYLNIVNAIETASKSMQEAGA